MCTMVFYITVFLLLQHRLISPLLSYYRNIKMTLVETLDLLHLTYFTLSSNHSYLVRLFLLNFLWLATLYLTLSKLCRSGRHSYDAY